MSYHQARISDHKHHNPPAWNPKPNKWNRLQNEWISAPQQRFRPTRKTNHKASLEITKTLTRVEDVALATVVKAIVKDLASIRVTKFNVKHFNKMMMTLATILLLVEQVRATAAPLKKEGSNDLTAPPKPIRITQETNSTVSDASIKTTTISQKVPLAQAQEPLNLPPSTSLNNLNFCEIKGRTKKIETQACRKTADRLKSKLQPKPIEISPELVDPLDTFACNDAIEDSEWENLKIKFVDKYPEVIIKALSLCDPDAHTVMLSSLRHLLTFVSGGETCMPLEGINDTCNSPPICLPKETLAQCIDRSVKKTVARWLNSNSTESQSKRAQLSLEALQTYRSIFVDTKGPLHHKIRHYKTIPTVITGQYMDVSVSKNITLSLESAFDDFLNQEQINLTDEIIKKFLDIENLSEVWQQGITNFIKHFPKTVAQALSMYDVSQELFFPTIKSLLIYVAIDYTDVESTDEAGVDDLSASPWTCFKINKKNLFVNVQIASKANSFVEVELIHRQQDGFKFDKRSVQSLARLKSYIEIFDIETLTALRSWYYGATEISAANVNKGLETLQVMQFLMSLYHTYLAPSK